MEDYFKELNIPVYHDNQEFTFGIKHFLLVMVTAKDLVIKDINGMKKCLQSVFKWLHPDILAFA
jgi:UDP-2,3-diacylglucosamine hydrolase